MKTRALSALCALLLPLCGAAAATPTKWQLTAACGFRGVGGDLTDRGIYLTNYPGSNLSQVELGYTADTGDTGLWVLSLTARRGSFDGPIIGSTQIATPNITHDLTTNGEDLVIFDFNGAPVTPGDTITFTQTAQYIGGASGLLYFDTGTGPCSNVTETDETTHPPLDMFRRPTVGLVVTEQTHTASCVASDNVMCIDDLPGDQRFKVTVTYHTTQGGGLSGTGQEIPMAPLGVAQGGLFWFFNPTNPEMLVKIIDGCALNQRIWVFISAGTNVGFTVTVHDTAFGATHIYTNQDLNPAPPIQDTSALTGCS
ncbi:MAG TPA: hypothetical protein VJA16_15900 [Thermoanaerobaculia bacterium]